MPDSADLFLARQVERLGKLSKRKRIVFPEAEDLRVRKACDRLSREGLIEPVLLQSVSPNRRYADLYHERRRSKGVTREEAERVALDPVYRAALMVAAAEADGGVAGAVYTTAETVRAALQCIGRAPEIGTVSGIFFMCVKDRELGEDGVLAFADCAMVEQPSAAEVAEIAISTAGSIRAVIGAEPRVALLSFSTKGSAKDPKMVEALKILRERAPGIEADGELQADAALVPAIGASKAPGSRVAGRANTLIFPDLASANIGYKLVQRLGGAAAFGPFLQGLRRPFNDLSRGCSAEDVYAAAVVTALQSEESGRAAV